MTTIKRLKNGWDQILDANPRTAEAYEQALCNDLQVLSEVSDTPDPDRAESLLRVVDLLAGDLVWKQASGSFPDFQRYQDSLNQVLRRFPDLTRLQDLDVWSYVGCWLDSVERGLEVLRTLPVKGRWEALLTSDRGFENRQAVLRFLYSVNKDVEVWPTTTTIAKEASLLRGVALSKQIVHLVLNRLHEHGLVLRDSYGFTHRHRISPTGILAYEALSQK